MYMMMWDSTWNMKSETGDEKSVVMRHTLVVANGSIPDKHRGMGNLECLRVGRVQKEAVTRFILY